MGHASLIIINGNGKQNRKWVDFFKEKNRVYCPEIIIGSERGFEPMGAESWELIGLYEAPVVYQLNYTSQPQCSI